MVAFPFVSFGEVIKVLGYFDCSRFWLGNQSHDFFEPQLKVVDDIFLCEREDG